jgi:RNA polymerase sigma factor for flagellar operon FliA
MRTLLNRGLRVLRDVSETTCLAIGRRIPARELRSIGSEALVLAVRDWDPTMAPFEPYVAQRVRWAMINHVRHRMGRSSSARALRNVGLVPDELPRPDELCEERADAERVRAAVRRLPKRERLIIERYYLDEGDCFEREARRLRLSKSWVSRLHARALERLRGALEAA